MTLCKYLYFLEAFKILFSFFVRRCSNIINILKSDKSSSISYKFFFKTFLIFLKTSI